MKIKKEQIEIYKLIIFVFEYMADQIPKIRYESNFERVLPDWVLGEIYHKTEKTIPSHIIGYNRESEALRRIAKILRKCLRDGKKYEEDPNWPPQLKQKTVD